MTADLINQILEENDGKHTDVTIQVTDPAGNVSYTLTVNTADIQTGNKLYVCAKDQKTGAYVLVNDKSYTVTKAGNVNFQQIPIRITSLWIRKIWIRSQRKY